MSTSYSYPIFINAQGLGLGEAKVQLMVIVSMGTFMSSNVHFNMHTYLFDCKTAIMCKNDLVNCNPLVCDGSDIHRHRSCYITLEQVKIATAGE